MTGSPRSYRLRVALLMLLLVTFSGSAVAEAKRVHRLKSGLALRMRQDAKHRKVTVRLPARLHSGASLEKHRWLARSPGRRALRVFNRSSGWRSFALSETHRNNTLQSYSGSNEWNHADLQKLFRATLPHVKTGRSKGIYLGVGAEQNYTMIADSKSSYAVLFDYDPVVNLIHHIHRSAFLHSKTPDEYVEFFANEKASKAIVLRDFERYVVEQGGVKGKKEIAAHVAAVSALWDDSQNALMVRARMNRVGYDGPIGSMEGSYLHDSEKFGHVRRMYREQRIKIAFGSLTDPEFFAQVNRTAAAMGEKINVVYASNAYDYLDMHEPWLKTAFQPISADIARDAVLLTSSRTSSTARTMGGFRYAETGPTEWAYPYRRLSDFAGGSTN